MGRILEVDDGKLLVASDIQGDWYDYAKVRDRFTELKSKGEADILVLNGDLIHPHKSAPYPDGSLDILDDLIEGQDPSVICLLGNHELMHIYHMGQVSADGHFFVEPLEEQIDKGGWDRERYVGFMKSMPYAITTRSGITIVHTGPNMPMAGFIKPVYMGLVESFKGDAYGFIDNLDHDGILTSLKDFAKGLIEARWEEENGSKVELEAGYFEDYTPEIGEVFSRSDVGEYLWDVFFNRNEREEFAQIYDSNSGRYMYSVILERYLGTMSKRMPQSLLISGHIGAPDGYQVLLERQLRISTSDGARDDRSKVLAVVNAKPNYHSTVPEVAMQQIVSSLTPLYKS